jgi:type I restriction enzyme, S subunit
MASDLPRGWRWSSWGDLIELKYGKALVGAKLDIGPVKVFGTNGPTGVYTESRHADGPGVIVGRKGAYRGVTWSPGPYWVIDTAFYVVPRGGVALNMDWVYRALSLVDINGLDSGSAIPSTRREDVYALSVAVPPLDVQGQIAQVLRSLDDKIDSSKRVSNASESVWLTYATHRLRDATAVPVTDLLTDAALVINDGYRAKNSELATVGIPFVRAGNLTAHGLELEAADRVPLDLAARVGAKRSSAWDTAFTSKGTVGRITLVPPGADFVYSPQVCFWRSADPRRLSPFVLHAWMRSSRFVQQINAVKGQTDMADYVSLRDQRNMVIHLPTEDVAREVHRVAESLARSVVTHQAEARTLRAIRDQLLPKLVTGKIHIPLAEEIAEVGNDAARKKATAA